MSFYDLGNFFGPPPTTSYYVHFNNYYRGGSYVPNISQNNAIPTSGQIQINQFRPSAVDFGFDSASNVSNIGIDAGRYRQISVRMSKPWEWHGTSGTDYTSSTYSEGNTPQSAYNMSVGCSYAVQFYWSVSQSGSGASATWDTPNNSGGSGSWNYNNDWLLITGDRSTGVDGSSDSVTVYATLYARHRDSTSTTSSVSFVLPITWISTSGGK